MRFGSMAFALALFGLTQGCTSIQGHHSLISNASPSEGLIAPVPAEASPVHGESCRYSVMIFGWGESHERPTPRIDEVVADALQAAPGSNGLANATVQLTNLYTFFFNKGCYVVDGTPVHIASTR